MVTETLKIAPSVYWVGVNDTVTRLFEGLWDVSEGVSYNSYLVVGSKNIALIDSVGSRFEEEHLAKIEQVIDPAEIEYLILNHMEQDHTEAVPKLLQKAPKAKVVLTPMAFSMLKAFYHLEPQTLIVRGDSTQIDLGGKSLRFVPTPFLHWPETMSTYLAEEKILFSCDLFGSFKRLPEKAILDADIQDVERYIQEASREYFAGVISRYREYVLKAVEKFKALGLEFEVLAPSHGPVYTAHREEVISLWSSWSRPDYARKVVIAVGSMYGTTFKLVEALVEGVEEAGGEAVVCNLVEDAPAKTLGALLDAPALIVGTPTYEHGLFPPVAHFLRLLESKKLTGRVAGAFGSFGWSRGGVKKLVERLNALGFRLVGNPLEVRGSPLSEDLEKARVMGRRVADIAFYEGGKHGFPKV
ncbi:FprA family A-type flavoprotein [Candidatus Hecatella orcuttiae]|uniref:FprA family A-type flavoprotein n=1 Tax=Candidatus Hecatella orcuttiae TaxID=1935119 RepID=UPI00286838EE|nr:FprA family A-type flavoprotein [Candidatus Hecatella orcuttiae]